MSIESVGPLMVTPAERALRCAMDQQPGEHDVCTVNQRYLADVLSTLRVLRQVNDMRGAVIYKLTTLVHAPQIGSGAVVEPRLCTRETCPEEVARKGAGL